jgi:hypothetical protein
MATPMIEALPIKEIERLAELEDVIARGIASFIEVGEALCEVRDSRLYKVEHGTFEDYCQKKWGITKSRANQLIGAAVVVENLATVVAKPKDWPGKHNAVLPTTERQVRPLTQLDTPAEQQAAWAEAVEAGDGKPTAKAVEAAVVRRIRPIVPATFSPEAQQRIDEAAKDSEILWSLKRNWRLAGKRDKKKFLAKLAEDEGVKLDAPLQTVHPAESAGVHILHPIAPSLDGAKHAIAILSTEDRRALIQWLNAAYACDFPSYDEQESIDAGRAASEMNEERDIEESLRHAMAQEMQDEIDREEEMGKVISEEREAEIALEEQQQEQIHAQMLADLSPYLREVREEIDAEEKEEMDELIELNRQKYEAAEAGDEHRRVGLIYAISQMLSHMETTDHDRRQRWWSACDLEAMEEMQGDVTPASGERQPDGTPEAGE